MKNNQPEVGDGVTMEWLFQFFPATVVRVDTYDGNVTAVYVKADLVVNPDAEQDELGNADYEFAPNPEANEEKFEFDEETQSYRNSYAHLILGDRSYSVVPGE